MIRKKEGYVAPPRGSIHNEVAKLLPTVPRELIEGLDFTALYTIHSEIARYDLNPEAVAEVNITGYRCGRDLSGAKAAVKQFRRDLKKQLADAVRRKRDEARAKAHAAKARERGARDKARVRAG
ncbi:MAG: hypothetical protein NTX71_10205 [Candidatus Aureabacteria bacterium]|nr:hypothetical protein [Candidatus Auribacterota bacterium]